MQLTITGHQMDVTDPLRDYVTTKMNKLTHHFDRITSVDVTLEIEKLNQIAKADLHVPGTKLHAHANEADMYAAIDGLTDKLNRQLHDYKEKLKNHRD